MTLTLNINTEQDMMQLGQRLVEAYQRVGDKGLIIFLDGVLGAGKTTLTRGFLRALGHEGAVKSPTYALVETYECSGEKINHWDFYRIHDPKELEFIGVREYFTPETLSLIEWPHQGGELIPSDDLTCMIELTPSARAVTLASHSQKGQKIIDVLASV